jgi:acetolactate synthase-1/2/3 large subunit
MSRFASAVYDESIDSEWSKVAMIAMSTMTEEQFEVSVPTISTICEVPDPFSLSDKLITDLAECGITQYFGVPGGAIGPFFSALARQQRNEIVNITPMRSEAGAAFAADGYYRATGRLAVCVTTTGPGIANLVTAVTVASSDRIPMLILTPQAPLPRQGRGAFQDSSRDAIDFVSILNHCTRYSTAITHPAQLSYRVAKALQIAQTAPFGPVHLSIPSEILAGLPAPDAPSVWPTALPISPPIDELAATTLVNEILNAKRLIFYVGDDAGPAAHHLGALAQALGGHVVSSPAGKRWVSHRDRTYLGVVGFAGHMRAQSAISRADLVVTFGATFDELSTNSWGVFANSRVIAVDQHASFVYRQPGAQLVIAETSQIVRKLQEVLTLNDSNQRTSTFYPPSMPTRSTSEDLVHPSDLMNWLNRKLPDDIAVHVDTGSSMAWATRYLSRVNPDTYRVAMGMCSMCWAISSVIGAAVASGNRIICITGDGAMLMSSLELTVAFEHHLPITYIVLNDSGLGMVRHGQKLAGDESIATQITKVRFDLLAKSCGVEAMRVEGLADLNQVPTAWLGDRSSGPKLIDVRIDPNAVPPIEQRITALTSEMEQQ